MLMLENSANNGLRVKRKRATLGKNCLAKAAT